MTEAHQSVHERELPGIIELETGNAFSRGGDCRLRQLPQLPAVDEGFDDVLLHVEIVVVDRREGAAQGRQVIDGLSDAVVGHIVSRGLGTQDEVIAYVLLDEAVAVVAANDRIGEAHTLDLVLQLAMVQLGDLAAEDRGDLVRLADGPIGVEEPFAELVEGGATMKHQVVAKFGLGKEQPVLASGFFALLRGEERGEAGQPLLAAGNEIARRELVSQFLQAPGLAHDMKAFEQWRKSTPSVRKRLASQ